MRLRLSIAIAVIICLQARPSRGSVVLASLSDPTVQTLIDLGGDGVTVGPLRFYDFGYVAPASNSPAAGAVSVLPITTDGDGLRFVSSWSAAFGSSLNDVITYQVQVMDPSEGLTTISLFSDGSAPLPGRGTFVTTSLAARGGGNTVIGRILTTFDDGITTPVDTTRSDNDTDLVNIPGQVSLSVTDAISVDSSSSPGGVASASTVENTFDPVPVPTPSASLVLPCVAAFFALHRGSRRGLLRSTGERI